MTLNQQLTSRTALKVVGSKIMPSQSTLVTVSASSSANTFVFWERYFLRFKKKGQKSMPHFWRETAALWAKKFSSVHAIKFQKQNAMWKKRGWNAYFLKETYEMLIISFQPPPAKKKKKWSKSDLIVNCERMCCRWLWLRRFDFLSGSYYPSQVHVLSIQRYRVSNQMVIVSSWSWNFYLDGLL